MDETDRTNYEQPHPRHPTERELLDRLTGRTVDALRRTDEAEERMARNKGLKPKGT